jgi:isoleucyl-tRNA synthetase
MRSHRPLIAGEILAVTFTEGRPSADVAPHRDAELGLTIWVRAAGG